jgi:Zn-dependent protease with chaperone function
MDFFEYQRQARKRSVLYVFLFCSAVICIGLALYTLTVWVFQGDKLSLRTWWNKDVFLYVFLGTIGFIGLASLYRILSLREGADAIAKALGARLVDPSTKDLKERKLLNVVEEMAIASGCPVPRVYVMDDEPQINAFAAGFSVQDAAICVTKGTLENLNRRELQGVVGHEFSHILNGDMRLNLKLMGVLFGIFALIVVGRFMVRVGGVSRGRKGKGNAGVILIGLALMLVGAIGYFFGLIIQAAVSRQREFLADASSVQFTRDPEAIGGALLKIARIGSSVEAPSAAEVSHMLFGARARLASIFATHPPIEERIKRVSPELLRYLEDENLKLDTESERDEGVSGKMAGYGVAGFEAGRTGSVRMQDEIGKLEETSLRSARDILKNMPEDISRALKSNVDASFLVFAMLLDEDEEVCAKQMKMLKEMAPHAKRYQGSVRKLDYSSRIALLDLATSRLRNLPDDAIAEIISLAKQIAMADRKLTVFEIAFLCLICLRLSRKTGQAKPERSSGALLSASAVLLGVIANAGSPEDVVCAEKAFEHGMKVLCNDPKRYMQKVRKIEDVSQIEEVSQSLMVLANASDNVKAKVIKAVEECVKFDRKITQDELVLLRFVGLALGVPVPLSFVAT